MSILKFLKQFRRILVRATNWVGDAVMSMPALEALREQFPGAHISILARPSIADLYRREAFCDELIEYELEAGWKDLTGKWRLAAQLRRRKFDCAILFQNAFEAAALVRVAGIPARIGYARDGRSWLLTHPIPVPQSGETPKHQRFYYLELLRRAKLINEYSPESNIRLADSRVAALKGRERFRGVSVDGSVIGVSPGAAYGGAKRWLPERFAEAAVAVARERDASVAIFGSKQESGICEAVCRRIEAGGRQCVNLCGATTLAEFVEFAAACEIFLTNDSGSMHIASALGVPTVAVFGATDEEATGPTGLHSRVVRQPVECSPCLLRECPIDHRCMTRVDSQRVVQSALSLVPVEKN